LVVGLLLPLAGCGGGTEPSYTPPAPAAPLVRPLYALGARDVRDGRVLVPQTALVVRGGIPGVFVFDEKHAQARFRVVRPGARRGTQVEVIAGLKGDERLVLGDLTAVFDGSPIQAAASDR
jgi:hypothetical protein